eukprot:TRINITY_DN3943_c0_g1_i1.p1 TRINITY_DN3943_c0_g1~~TRINITY_DN3943_c0_g1_i1.p1  ORF type:complete len:156 (+),score=8.94 TRINITY_DN3943_c0_g1_i1:177-644(+)
MVDPDPEQDYRDDLNDCIREVRHEFKSDPRSSSCIQPAFWNAIAGVLIVGGLKCLVSYKYRLRGAATLFGWSLFFSNISYCSMEKYYQKPARINAVVGGCGALIPLSLTMGLAGIPIFVAGVTLYTLAFSSTNYEYYPPQPYFLAKAKLRLALED